MIASLLKWMNPAMIEKESIRDALIRYSSFSKGNLLDLGCGKKPYKKIFERYIQKYVGLDIDKSEADILCSIENISRIKKDSFDTILSTQVLEHVENPAKMIKDSYKILKKGGCIILTAPMTWQLHEQPRDFYRYTKYGLRYLLESAGFRIIVLKERGGFWKVIGQKLNSKFYGNSKKKVIKMIKGPFCAGINLIFIFLDWLNKDFSETLGYVVIAKK